MFTNSSSTNSSRKTHYVVIYEIRLQ